MSALVKVVGTAAQLAARNPVVPRGILAVAYDTGAVKVGDGVTTYNALTALSGGGGGSADKLGLTSTAVKTGNYTAAAGDLVPVDTTSGAVTVTLPTAPADGSVVAVKHVVQGSTNAVNLALGGSDVFNVAGGATTGSLALLNQSALFQYRSTGAIWYAVANDFPLTAADARYLRTANNLSDVTAATARTNLGLGTAATSPVLVSTGAATTTEYVYPQFVTYAGASRSVAVGFMGATPMWLPAGTYDRIGCRIVTVGSAGAVIRLGIYTADANNKPSTLVLDAGTVAGDGTTGFKEITISHTQATAALVFLSAATQTAAVTMQTADQASGGSGLFPIPNTAGISASGLNEYSWYVNGTVTGALPSTPTFAKNSNSQWLIAMCLRKA